MEKSRFHKTLSAITLFALAVIWLIYLCAGNSLGKDVTNVLSIVVNVLSVVTVAVVFIALSSNDVPGIITFIITILSLLPILLQLVSVCLEICSIDLFHAVDPVFTYVIDIIYKILIICLYIGLIINSWGFTESFIFRIIFLAIGLFLIFCVAIQWIPALAQNFDIPLIGFTI